MDKAIKYLKDVRKELAQVTWPGRDEVIKMSAVVVVASIVVGVYIGALDYLFTALLGNIIR